MNIHPHAQQWLDKLTHDVATDSDDRVCHWCDDTVTGEHVVTDEYGDTYHVHCAYQLAKDWDE